MPPRPDSGYNPVPTVSPDTQAPNDYIRSEAQPTDFGAQTGQAVQGLGQTIGKVGNDIGSIASVIQQRNNQHWLDQAVISLQDQNQKILYGDGTGDPNDPSSHGYLGLKGQNAVSAQSSVMKQLDANRQALLGSAPNALVQNQFDSASRKYNELALSQIGSHANQQWGQAAVDTQSAGQDVALRGIAAAPKDEQAFTVSLESGMVSSAKRALLSGGSDAAMQAAQLDFQDKAYTARAQALAASDPASALAFVQANPTKFSASTLDGLVTHLTPQADKVAGQALATKYYPDAAATGPIADGISSQAQAAGVDPGLATTAAHLESGLNPSAKNPVPSSTAAGLFGMTNSTWLANGGTPDNRGDVATQIALGVKNLAASQQAASAALGRPAQPWETYLVHQQGQAGGKALLSADPSLPAVDALAPSYGGRVSDARAAIQNNGGSADMTTGQFLQTVQGKYQAATTGGVPAAPGAASAASFAPTMPDVNNAITQIMADPSATPGAKEHAIEAVTQQHRYLEAANADQRNQLDGSINDGAAALAAGHDYTWDERQIAQFHTPEETTQIVNDLQHAKLVGQAVKSVQFASPAEIAAKQASYSTALDSPANFDQNLKDAHAYAAAVKQRNDAVASDPASYVLASPTVAQAAQAASAANSATRGPLGTPQPGAANAATTAFENYARTSLAEQTRLGVDPSQQHVLTTDQSAKLVQQVTSSDPAKTDIGGELDSISKTYGKYWPKVLGDLVAAKLPGVYQVVASMTPEPGAPDVQARARSDLQTTYQQAAAMGGVQKYRASLSPGQAVAVDQNVDSDLADFQASTRQQSGGQDLYNSVRDAVKLQAYGLVARGGMSGENAVAAAANQIIHAKYDFTADGARVPKGTLDDVETGARNIMAGLKPADLADPGGDTSITPAQRGDIALDAAQRGMWVTNADESGLIRMGVTKGGYNVVRWTNGQPVELRFSDLQHLSNPPPQSAPPMKDPRIPGTFAGQVTGPGLTPAMTE